MIVPRHWAEARVQHRVPGRQVTVRRFGWSDLSAQDAERMAQERAQEALTRILAGDALPRREHKVPYNGAEGLPIREEVLAVHGASVITRNAYGAQCLNTPNVLFADIDFDRSRRLGVWAYGLTFAALLALGAYWKLGWGLLFTPIAAGILGSALAALLHRVVDLFFGGAERRAVRRVRRFVASHPDWRVRLYRTPLGLRALALHRTFDPHEPAVRAFFDAVAADPEYVRMSQRQRCFRARLTPKPWRVGMSAHMKPRPGVWPVNPARLPERQRWVAEYERACADYASCRYFETLGEGGADSAADGVRELHDRLCKAETLLPLA